MSSKVVDQADLGAVGAPNMPTTETFHETTIDLASAATRGRGGRRHRQTQSLADDVQRRCSPRCNLKERPYSAGLPRGLPGWRFTTFTWLTEPRVGRRRMVRCGRRSGPPTAMPARPLSLASAEAAAAGAPSAAHAAGAAARAPARPLPLARGRERLDDGRFSVLCSCGHAGPQLPPVPPGGRMQARRAGA